MIISFIGKPGQSVSVDVGDDFEFGGIWEEQHDDPEDPTNGKIRTAVRVASDGHGKPSGEVHWEGFFNRGVEPITVSVAGLGTWEDEWTGGHCGANVYTERDADERILAVIASYRNDGYHPRARERVNEEATASDTNERQQ